MKLTREYLEKIATRSQSGNIHKISKDVFVFTMYNFLPGTNINGLDGHYSFAVNITNFKYLYWKDSDYGGLTYVRKNKNKTFLYVHLNMIKEIEGIIAAKLLGSYWYESDKSNGRGKNLFHKESDDEYDWNPKISLICTFVDDYPNEPLGKLSEIELLAIKKLQILELKRTKF